MNQLEALVAEIEELLEKNARRLDIFSVCWAFKSRYWYMHELLSIFSWFNGLIKIQGNNSHYQIFSETVLQFIIIIYTNMNRNKKILYKSICMNKDYPEWRGSSGEPIIQGAGLQLILFLSFPPPLPRS